MKISTLLLAGVGAFCCTSTMAQTSDPSVGDQITEVANITPSTVAYRIKGARGYLFSQSSSATKLSSNYLKKDQKDFTIPYDTENNSNFNFVLIPSALQTNGYYIYNVSTNKFVEKTSTAEADLLSLVETPNLDNCVWKFRKSEHTQSNIDEYNRYTGKFPFSITNGSYYLTISDASMAGVKTYSNVDAGSRFQLIVADQTTDFTAACNRVKVYETQTRKEQIENLVASHAGDLGYPTQKAWEAYKAAVAKAQQVSEVNTALETMLAVNNLVYPTDGQAYYIRPVNRGATNRSANRLYCGTDNTLSIGVGNSDDASAIFYCHKVGEHKYIFTNNVFPGKYMRFRADTKSFNGDASGFADAYGNEQIFTFYPMQNVATDTEVYIGSESITKGDLNQLGLFLLQGQLESGSSAQHYLMANTNDKKFHNGGETVIYYTASNNTCAFYLEKALQQNAFTTKALTVGNVSANIATYSSPFPVNLPDGVDAYIAKQEGENNVVLQKITGALPANTGVILSSETAKEYIPTARTTEALATVNAADNMLKPTTGSAVAADVNAYILSKDKDNNSVAVFKKLSSSDRTIKQYKAYLELDGAQSAQLMNFAFAGSDLTGIQNVTETSAKSKTAYDLAGRKVGKLQKGIYIVNGKKVIVK